jgi:ATP/maltotriose-dependent transcriptional regulator MalT
MSESNIVPRKNLLNLLKSNRDKNLLLVCSPAGYGKTALINDFLQKNNISAAWLSATHEMNHLYTFFIYFVHSLKIIDPSFGKNTIRLLESRREKLHLSKNARVLAIEFVGTFINEFKAHFTSDIFVVIDDFQNIEESEWATSLFNKLFESMPENLHVIIITRELPDLDYLPLVVENKILRIGVADLVFKFDEIAELLEKIYSIKYSEEGVRLLEEKIGGWITGIHMLLQTHGSDFSKLKINSQAIPENIFNSLAEEIYMNLEPEAQSFLLNTALVENFTEDICDYTDSTNNTRLVFKNLLNKHLILKENKAGTGPVSDYYSYHTLFRKFLIAKLYELYSQDKISELRKNLLKYYTDHNNILAALNYLFAMKDFQTGITLMTNNFDKLFNEGKFEYLWSWLSAIDKDLINKNPHLVFYLGILYKYFIGDLESSLEYIQKAINSLKNRNDAQFLIKCYINKASVLINLGRTREVLDELTDLLNEETSAENKSRLLYYLAFAYYQNSKYDIASNFLNKALEICTANNLREVEINIYILLGHINLIRGEYKQSTLFYEKIENHNPNILDMFETLCNRTLMHSQSSNYKQAAKCLNKLEEIIRDFPTAIFKIPYLLAKQAYFFESCNYEKNSAVLKEINSIAHSMSHKNYMYLSYRLLSDTFYHMDDYERAQVYYEYAFSCLNEENDNELEKIEMAVVKTLIRKKIEPDDTIESILLLAYDYYEREELHYSKVQVCYHLADYYYQEGNFMESMKYFRECLKESKEREYISHLLREMSHSEQLFQHALSNKIEEEFINNLKILKSEMQN